MCQVDEAQKQLQKKVGNGDRLFSVAERRRGVHVSAAAAPTAIPSDHAREPEGANIHGHPPQGPLFSKVNPGILSLCRITGMRRHPPSQANFDADVLDNGEGPNKQKTPRDTSREGVDDIFPKPPPFSLCVLSHPPGFTEKLGSKFCPRGCGVLS